MLDIIRVHKTFEVLIIELFLKIRFLLVLAFSNYSALSKVSRSALKYIPNFSSKSLQKNTGFNIPRKVLHVPYPISAVPTILLIN